MAEHICEKCIYRITPESIRDYYLKTRKMPSLHHWNEETFKHLYWLCTNPNVAEIDKVNDYTICKPCVEYNFHGNCSFYREDNAEDIKPSSVVITCDKTECTIGDEVTFTAAVKPAEDNEQEISYTYQWYKNNRKLFQKKTAEVTIKMTEEALDEYFCIVQQSIVNNGDGGNKSAEVKSNYLTITVDIAEETPEETTDDTSENSTN